MAGKMHMNKKGETLILVVIIAALLLVVGGAVVGFAANDLSTTSRNAQSKNVYYVSKSVANVVDKMMGTETASGKLGAYIRDRAVTDLKTNTGMTDGASLSRTGETLSPEIDLSSISRLEKYYVTDMNNNKNKVEITYDSVCSYSSGVISVALNNLYVKYKVKDDQGNSYKLYIKYNYNGNETYSSSTWSLDKWVVENTKNR